MNSPAPSSNRLVIAPNAEFVKNLKARIAPIVSVNEQRGTAALYTKVAVILAWFFLTYLGLFFSSNSAVSILLCISLGLATAGIGFNIFHDSIHGAFSYRRSVNHFWAFVSCSIIGPSHFIWRHKHNYLHHQFPNIEGWDDDLETRGGLRLSPSQKYSARYRYQHLYAPFIYALTTVEWLFVRDFIRYFSGKMNEVQKLPQMKPSDHIEFWVSKLIYVTLTVFIPLQFFSISQYLVGFLIAHITTSLTLAAVFQLAHVMTDSAFPTPSNASGKIDSDWAKLQLETTVNFAPQNKLLNWYAGGLNFQIEHHLMPAVCHTHYKKLSPVIQAMAKENGYSYHSLPTHWSAVVNHYEMLKHFSMPENEPELAVTPTS